MQAILNSDGSLELTEHFNFLNQFNFSDSKLFSMQTLKKITILFFTSIAFQAVEAQNKQLFEKGLQLKANYKNNEGLALFQLLLKSDSGNVDYLSNTSYFYSKVGILQGTETRRIDYFQKASYLAKKALKINPNSAEAHYAYALALGRLNENASSKQKITNAKIIKQEAEQAIKLNPQLGGAYHILGRWHRTIAGFGFVEKMAINTLFGGVPEGGSYEAAITNFQKAIQFEPKYMLHYYELAETYFERNEGKDKELARQTLKKAMELPVKNEDDKLSFQKCMDLLQKIH
jgi:tetratricopeptide (TPR) repeat protein